MGELERARPSTEGLALKNAGAPYSLGRLEVRPDVCDVALVRREVHRVYDHPLTRLAITSGTRATRADVPARATVARIRVPGVRADRPIGVTVKTTIPTRAWLAPLSGCNFEVRPRS